MTKATHGNSLHFTLPEKVLDGLNQDFKLSFQTKAGLEKDQRWPRHRIETISNQIQFSD